MGYLGSPLVPINHDIRISLKLIQGLADTELRFNQVLNLLLNEHVEIRLSLLYFYTDLNSTCVCR